MLPDPVSKEDKKNANSRKKGDPKPGDPKSLDQLARDIPLICQRPEAQPLAILSSLALNCSFIALEQRSSEPERSFQGSALQNLGNYVMVSCRALVFASMWFFKLMESCSWVGVSYTGQMDVQEVGFRDVMHACIPQCLKPINV